MGKFSTLEKSILTRSWSLEERSALAHFLEEKRAGAESTVQDEGSNEQCLYFVDAGLLRVQFEGLKFDLREGDSFGELSLVLGHPKKVLIKAVKDSSMWTLPYHQWLEMRKASPLVTLRLMESVAQKIAELLSESKPPSKLFMLASN